MQAGLGLFSDGDVSDVAGDRLTTAFDFNWIGRSTGRAERGQIVVLSVGIAPTPGLELEAMLHEQARRRGIVSRIVARFGGAIGRVDPDGLVAAWGWRTSNEGDARFAVAAAIEMAADQRVAASCAVEAGIAVTPDLQEELPGFDFAGTMVAAATRCQSLAAPGEVLVSDTVCGLLGDAFELVADRRGDGSGKGLWTVHRRVKWPEHRSLVDCTGLIGREFEISQLDGAWRVASSGSTRLLAIVGEDGSGKSALVAELKRTVLGALGSYVAIDCLPEGHKVPLEPVRVIVEQIARLPGPLPPPPTSSPLVHLGEIQPFEGDVVGRNRIAACRAALKAVAASPQALDSAFAALVAHKAAARPLAIVIEDLHWADAATIRLLSGLDCWSGGQVRVLVVATCRHGASTTEADVATAALLGRWPTLVVPRLSRLDIERLIEASGGAGMSERMRLRIAELADGIPLYANELTRLCADMGEFDEYPRLLATPNRLNAGLTNRLDALATLKPLAQAAAVLGRLFDSRVLAAVLGMDVRVIEERLEMLVRMGILTRRRRQPACQYRFEHALIWTQAYGSVLRTRRRVLHAKIGSILTGALGDIVAPPPEAIAHHWTKAGDHANAFTWWAKAAHAAAEQGSAADAVAYANEALNAQRHVPGLCVPHEEARLMGLLGGQLRVLRGSTSSDTVAAYERALEIVSSMPARTSDIDLEVAWGLAAIQLVRGEIQNASRTSSKLLSDAAERGRQDIIMLALRVHGTARLLGGGVAEAIESFSDAVSRYDRQLHGELYRRYVSDPGAVALAHLAMAQAIAGQREGASRSCRQALALSAEIGHSHTAANVLGVVSLAALYLDDGGQAAALARAGQEIAQRYGHRYWEIRARLVLAWETGMRMPARGLELIEAELAHYQSMGAERATVLSCCLAADVAILAGRPERALEFVAPVRTRGQQQGEWLYEAALMRIEALARVHLDRTQLPRALDQVSAAEALARGQGAVAFAERAATARAELLAIKSRVRRGRSPAAPRSP